MQLQRAISFAGLRAESNAPWAGAPRNLLNWAAHVGFSAVVLDVTAQGFRPRELDNSARRDIVAVLRRSGIECRGLDAFIPPSHFKDSANIDRAVSALLQALELAGDLVRLTSRSIPVSTALPVDTGADVISRLRDAVERTGVALADCSWPARGEEPRLDLGVDPAAILASGADPCDVVLACGRPAAVARLSDLTSTGRCAPGDGRLDLLRYEVSLVTAGYSGSLVVDLRGVLHQAEVAARSLQNR